MIERQRKITRLLIETNRLMVDNMFHTTDFFQEQGNLMSLILLEQLSGLEAVGSLLTHRLTQAYRKAWEELKKGAESHFQRTEEFFRDPR
ncbi:MAG: hypothetical protein JXO48_03950 [Deltaproteobacteria bacterium]|nr:hypothetical protein [Deltaproteobacteria bacterium]